MKRLLLEIGAEEIPAGYIEPALKALEENLLKKLEQARISHGPSATYGTPRRLAISIADVAEKQEEVTTEVLGPPERLAFDENGQPTMAASKFAEKLGIDVTALRVAETAKGRYLSALTTDPGQPTEALLAQQLPEIICAVPFPKTMKWADQHILFARPIHSILALFGTQVIPFSLAGIKSDNWTWGHSIMNRGRVPIHDPDTYVETLRRDNVIADITERKEKIVREIAKAAQKVGGRILPDPALIDTVTHLVEYPVPIVGNFDPSYLELPQEILITAMREHQKYFALVNEKGKLLPHFIAVNNTRTRDEALASKGHERVLRARLEDARFFYRSDRAAGIETWISRLKAVLFQAKLGSVYDKVLRIVHLTEFLCDELSADQALRANAARAAHLCKADLVSQVVGEFPKLQGIMGRVYAAESGEPTDVATAIEEHYQPTFSGGALPQTPAGALVALADKMDTICGCFSVGLIPTGAADPYALRRQAIGIIQILLEKKFPLSLTRLIETGVGLFKTMTDQNTAETVQKITEFFSSRMVSLLIEDGFSRDVVAAVTAASTDRVPDVWERTRALEKLKAEPDFEPLAVAFKRVVNIIRKAESAIEGAVNTDLFEAPCEKDLYLELKAIREKVHSCISEARVDEALREIATLRGAVDAFFDGVMVMAEDPSIRNNRLLLLCEISKLFAAMADFSKLST